MQSEFLIHPGESVQNAVDRASGQGGGRVCLLPGVHRSGTLYLKSNVELNLRSGSVLVGEGTDAGYDILPDELFGECHTDPHNRAFLAAENAENIAITGFGTIEGRGPEFYGKTLGPGGFYEKKALERPRMLHFANCRRIRIENVRFHDSPRWTMWFIKCSGVSVHGVEIFGDPRMINNDGIHFFGGSGIAVSDCRVSTGDDALVARSSHAWHADTGRVVLEDMTVSNCVLESRCQAIRIGCPGDDLIRNCRFSNLILKGRNGIFFDNPLRYWQHEFATPFRQTPHEIRNLSFSGITVSVSGLPIEISVDEGVETGLFDDIVFSDILLDAGRAICFRGRSVMPLGRIVLNNVRGRIRAEQPLVVRNVRRLEMSNVCLETGI